MKYITLGTDKTDLSVIGLGTWAIGGANWSDYDEKSARSAIDTALESGITLIDTSPVYGRGRAESLVGESVKGTRDRVVVATKCGLDPDNPFRKDLSPEFIEKDLYGSLKRLGTDYIDIYICHWPDPSTPLEKTMEAMKKFQAAGKIKHIGLSNFSADQIAEAARYADIAMVQPHYSLLHRDIEERLLPLCMEMEIPVIPYGVLGGGMLTGKYREWTRFRKNDARSFFYSHFREERWDNVNELVNLLRDMAAEKNTLPGNIAIAWALDQPGVAGALAGARSPVQVKTNVSALEVLLSQEEKTLLHRASRAAGT